MSDEVLYTGLLEHKELPAFIKECGFLPGQGTYVLAENQPAHVVERSDRQALLIFDKFKLEMPSGNYAPYDNYKNYASGCIFSEQGELRWEKQADQVRIVYLGDPSFASVSRPLGTIYKSRFVEKTLELKKFEPHEKYSFYYLFGTKLDKTTIEQINGDQLKNVVKLGDFAELRIHRVLDYPAPGQIGDKGYVQLQVREYVDRESGQVQLFRFQGLIPERELDMRKERAG